MPDDALLEEVMRENKAFQKRPLRHTVRTQVQVISVGDFRLVADRMENLSSWGMLVSPADPVLTGERVYVSFQLPGTEEWFDACAVVTRVLHGRRPSDSTRKLGLEFEGMRPYERYRLRRALEALPASPPGVRPGRRAGGVSLRALAS
jgi:PilZ domain